MQQSKSEIPEQFHSLFFLACQCKNAAIQRCENPSSGAREGEQISIGNLPMPDDWFQLGERIQKTEVRRPEFMLGQSGDAFQQCDCFARRDSVSREFGITRNSDEPDLCERAGAKTGVALPGKPLLRCGIVDVRRPCQGDQQVDV